MQTNKSTRNQNKKSQSNFDFEFINISRKTTKTSSASFLKYLFLNEKNSEITKNFLSSLMADVNLPKIVAVQTYVEKPFATKHNEIFNLSALDSKGQYFNIELMTENEDDCIKRSMFYWAKRFTASNYDGKDFNAVIPTVSITLTEKKIFSGLNKFHWCFLPFDIQNRLVNLDNHQQIHFIELSKFLITKDDDYISYLKKGHYPVTEKFFSWMCFLKEGWRKNFIQLYGISNPYVLTAKEEYEKFLLQ